MATVTALLLVCYVGILRQADAPVAKQKVAVSENAVSENKVDLPEAIPKKEAIVVASLAAPNDFAARIVSMSENTLWAPDAGPRDFLMRLSAGEQLTLRKGVVKLEFASKAFAVLTSPAELEILGPGEVLLHQGKLTGRSEEGDFIVRTPSAYVVDVGTAFGVSVNGRMETDVIVFDGEVHVQRTSASEHKVRLTSGMSIHADESGLGESSADIDQALFNREFNGERPSNLAPNELSLVDIVCGSSRGEYRSAGSIDPEMGTWSTLPWSETKGVRGRVGHGKVVPVDWNPWVHGIFVPTNRGGELAVDLNGGTVDAPAISGGAWGSVWARRHIDRQLDPLASKVDKDTEGFWGAGTTTALFDRSRWVRDGIVGMHANVGITIDLEAIRKEHDSSLQSFRGVLAHLEKSHVSQPFHPQAQTTFQVYVDGELRYERKDFCRLDGDAMFGAELHDSDRFLSLIVLDSNDGPIYDRVILMDPGPGAPPAERDRAAVLGEFGGLGFPVAGHMWQQEDNWGYRSFQNSEQFATAYEEVIAKLRPLVESHLSAAVYTQITDVEIEVNGLITYDRKIIKANQERIRTANARLFAALPSKSHAERVAASVLAWWRFEEGAAGKPVSDISNRMGAIAAHDSSGRNNHLYAFAEQNAPSISRSVSRRSLGVAHVANRLCLDDSMPLGNGVSTRDLYTNPEFSRTHMDVVDRFPFSDWTIEASFCLSELSGEHVVLTKEESRSGVLSPLFQIGVFGVPSKIGVEIVDDSGKKTIVSSDVLAKENEWQHVVVTCEDSLVKLYIASGNSRHRYSLEGEATIQGSLSQRRGTWIVGRGCESGGVGRDFHGWIDEIRISTKALKESEFLFGESR